MAGIYTKQDCIDAIERVAEEIGESPTKKQFNDRSISPSATTIIRRFGSWNEAKRKSSVKPHSREKYTKQDCIDAIEGVAEEIGKSPTYKEYQNYDILPAASTIREIFGSWNDAKRASSLEEYDRTYYNIGEVPDRVPLTQDEWEEATADRRQIWRKRMYVEEEKLERGCQECEYDKFATALSFHHEDPSEKNDSVSQLVHNGKSYEKINNEMAKCEVLCANCHMVAEYGR